MKAYCDSSFDERNGVAGIGVTVIDGQKRRVYSNWIRARTNNEAELFAIHLASIIAGADAEIYSDSQTAISYIENNVGDKPRTREQYLNHKHCEFWAAQIRRRGVKAIKIKAHEKKFEVHSIGNRLADLLANEGRAKYYSR
jgi:ribonuclease HI